MRLHTLSIDCLASRNRNIFYHVRAVNLKVKNRQVGVGAMKEKQWESHAMIKPSDHVRTNAIQHISLPSSSSSRLQ